MANRVRLQATTLDVHVDGVRVGWVTDCGDCWRIGILGRRNRRAYNRDFDTRRQAVAAVVEIVS
jgi:hypothetical protein